MTKEKAKRLLDNINILQAFADGSIIQWRYAGDTDWCDCTDGPDPQNDFKAIYRIKPESQYRPWKPEEVPVGAIVKSNGKLSCNYFCYVITGVSNAVDIYVFIGALSESSRYSPEACLVNYVHSTDNGKTWQPCGVLV